MRRVERALILAGLCALVAACSSKGYNTDNPDWAQGGMPLPPKVTSTDAEWQESEAPPPPKFDVKRLEPIAMPPYMTLKFGVDPATITITHDGVVRYVVVASNTHNQNGSLNAYYEAVRCSTAEMKSYARFDNGAWEEVKKPEWKSFRDLNSSYSRQLATQGLCRGNAPRDSVKDIVANLRDPARKLQ
ncbi:CNP1-like family protein [Variovorax sp. PAMC26660]|uniref:CNP1-like family protein n=1 Tax=Variovorax sp. PAMC26660 TaxID=2762322 RepID=UPI0021C31149|nr:CNP1-like family protein [Variovorax sp. PAMC26660]